MIEKEIVHNSSLIVIKKKNLHGRLLKLFLNEFLNLMSIAMKNKTLVLQFSIYINSN